MYIVYKYPHRLIDILLSEVMSIDSLVHLYEHEQ